MKIFRLFLIMLLIVFCVIIFTNRDSESELIVYDADGQLLGDLIGREVTDTVTIYIKSLDIIGGINVTNGLLKITIKSSLYFNSFDCTGTPYISPFATYHIIGNNNIFYMGEKVAPFNFDINSRLNTDGTCESSSESPELVTALEVIPPFSLPVALPLMIEREPTHPGKWNK